MPHWHDEGRATATVAVNTKASIANETDAQQDLLHKDEEQNDHDNKNKEKTIVCDQKATDRLLSLATTATRHDAPREPSVNTNNESPAGTQPIRRGSHPAITPSPMNALQQQQLQQQQQHWMAQQQQQQQHPFQHYSAISSPMFSIYHGTKPICASPIRCRSPVNNNDEENIVVTAASSATTTPQRSHQQRGKNHNHHEDRCTSPPRTRNVAMLDHHFQQQRLPQPPLPPHQQHSSSHHNPLVSLPAGMMIPGSPIHRNHHQHRLRNGIALHPTLAAAAAANAASWAAMHAPSSYPYVACPIMAGNTHLPTTATYASSHKRPAPLAEEGQDLPSAKRRLSLPLADAVALSPDDSNQPPDQEVGTSIQDEKKKNEGEDTTADPQEAKVNDQRREEVEKDSKECKRIELKDEKQRVISPSSSNDCTASKGDDDEGSQSTTGAGKMDMPPRGGAAAQQGPAYPHMMMMMMHHHSSAHPYFRSMRPFPPRPHHQHQQQHHPLQHHSGYPPAFGAGAGAAPHMEMHHPSGWYSPMCHHPGPSPPFPYPTMSHNSMGSSPPSPPSSSSSQQSQQPQTLRPHSPPYPCKALFPHRGPPLSPVRSPNHEQEMTLSHSRCDDESAQRPLPCTSRASTPESMEPSSSSNSIKSVADWQKAAMATGLAPSANRCVPLKAPIPNKYWGETKTSKDLQLPDFHRLVNYPDYLTKSRPNQADTVAAALSKANNGRRHCVMCGKLRLCSASTLHLAAAAATVSSHHQRGNRKRNDDDGDGGCRGDDDENGSCSPCNSNNPKNKGAATTTATTHIIPRQNKGLCTACDVTVWVMTETGVEIKWCKGCKNFRPWVAFGDKGLATKCVRCRDRQREKYALQKEESGHVRRRRSTPVTMTTTTTSSVVPMRPQQPRRRNSTARTTTVAVAAAASPPQEEEEEGEEEEEEDDEDAEHVAAARGLRNLMAASM